ncbi:MAG: carboxypeptidase regulatory-like domain-containing protein, partial [Planctomycetales bacterium]|nr:carboxypeptidase regulatory-like domain-containing protein [Planctomycetales bacterium]
MNALVWLTPELSTRVCVTLLHSLWQIAALAVVAWLAGRLWCKRSAERAYAAHALALLMSFVCVPITFLLTENRPDPSQVVVGSVAEIPAVVVDHPVESPVASPMAWSHAIEGVGTAPRTDGMHADAPHAGAGDPRELDLAAIWGQTAPWLAGFYAVGVGLMLIRIAVAVATAEQLRGRSRPVSDGPLADALHRLGDTWSLRVVPTLASVEQIVVPKVVGLVKPTILVPTSALTGLSTEQLEMILAHELAHVRRYDMWVNLVQRLAEAALFFNPALWVLSRRISSLREYCCDELACGGEQQRGEDAHLQYAQALLRVVELAQTIPSGQSGIAVLAASGSSPSELRRRVARLFGEPLREPLQLSRGAVLPLLFVAAVMVAQPVLNTLAENPGGRLSVSENEIGLHVVGLNGDPIPNVEVEIRAEPSSIAEQVLVGQWLRGSRYGAFTKTDEQGQLVIRLDKPPTRLGFSVKHPGYGPYWAGWDSTNHAEALPKLFTMHLEEAWTVGGIVTDEQGMPVEGARIRPSINFKKRPGDREQLGIGIRVESQTDGSWRFACVPASLDALTIEVQHPDYQSIWSTLSRDVFEVAPGRSLSKIELSKGLSVTGTVTDEAGAPIEGALIRTQFANDVRKATTDKGGAYILTGCQSKMARIVVSADGKALDMQEVRVDPDMQPVNFTLKPGGKVRVRVVDENGKGIPKARIFFQRWRDHIDYFEFDHVNQYADENGVWEWDEAPLDEFRADICRPDGMQLSSQPLITRDEEYVFSPPAALVV